MGLSKPIKTGSVMIAAASGNTRCFCTSIYFYINYKEIRYAMILKEGELYDYKL